MWPFRKTPKEMPVLKEQAPKNIKETLGYEAGFSDGYNAYYLKQEREKSGHTIDDLLKNTFQRTGPFNPSESVAVMDAAMDETLGYSGGDNPQMRWFLSQGFIGWQACAAVSQHWLVDKACTVPARDAARVGYDLSINEDLGVAPEILEKIKDGCKLYGIDESLVQFYRMCQIFGIRHALFKFRFDNEQEMREFYAAPYNPDGIKKGSFLGISQIDPMWMSPGFDAKDISDPAAINFYNPTYWNIAGLKVHRSHFVIIRTCEVPDILKPTYYYGGIPLPQRIMERVYAAERTANEAPTLAMNKRLRILKCDVINAFTRQAETEQKIKFLSRMADNHGVLLVDRDDSVEQLDTALADMDSLIMTQYQIVAAIAGIPATKLIETTPKGFNSAGDYEADSYAQKLESIQKNDFEPLMQRFLECFIRSEICQQHGIEPFTVDVCWNSPDVVKAAERADIKLKEAQIDQVLIASGIVSPTEARARVIAEKESGYNGLTVEQEGESALENELRSMLGGDDEQNVGQ